MNAHTGTHIAWFRRKNNLRAEDISMKLSIPLQLVFDWENGTNFPDEKQLAALAKFLNTSESDLL